MLVNYYSIRHCNCAYSATSNKERPWWFVETDLFQHTNFKDSVVKKEIFTVSMSVCSSMCISPCSSTYTIETIRLTFGTGKPPSRVSLDIVRLPQYSLNIQL